MDEFNTWGKVWTYVVVIFLSCSGIGIGWGLNVYTHWEPNVKQNFKIGKEANDKNLEIMRQTYKYAKALNQTGDTLYLDSLLSSASQTWILRSVAESKANDSIVKDTVSTYPSPKITDIEVKYIRDFSFRVYWSVNKPSKGQVEFGTMSGVYPFKTKMEINTLMDHAQTVGGSGNPSPLIPNTEYFFRIYMEDEFGNKSYSQEYKQKTN